MSDDGRVVAGWDGSPDSVDALGWAWTEACRRDVALEVVAVLHPPRPPSAPALLASRALLHDAVRGEVSAALEVLDAPDRRVRSDVRVVTGAPVAELQRAAAGASLLVVGHRGRGASESAGSTSTTLAAGAPCPVAVVRCHGRPCAPRDRPVVAGVDASYASRGALHVAADLAGGPDPQVVAVLAHPVEVVDPRRAALDVPAEPGAAARLLEDFVAGVREAHPHVDLVTRVRVGRPGEVLVDASRGASAVVVSTTGGSLLRRLLARPDGSGCPLVVVPATTALRRDAQERYRARA